MKQANKHKPGDKRETIAVDYEDSEKTPNNVTKEDKPDDKLIGNAEKDSDKPGLIPRDDH